MNSTKCRGNGLCYELKDNGYQKRENFKCKNDCDLFKCLRCKHMYPSLKMEGDYCASCQYILVDTYVNKINRNKNNLNLHPFLLMNMKSEVIKDDHFQRFMHFISQFYETIE